MGSAPIGQGGASGVSSGRSWNSSSFKQGLNTNNYMRDYAANRLMAEKNMSADAAKKAVDNAAADGRIDFSNGLQKEELSSLGLESKQVDTYVAGIWQGDTPETITNKDAAAYFYGVDLAAQLRYQDLWQKNPEEARQRVNLGYNNSNNLVRADLAGSVRRAQANSRVLSDSGQIHQGTKVDDLLNTYNEEEGTGFEPKYKEKIMADLREKFQKNLEDQLGENYVEIISDACHYQEFLRYQDVNGDVPDGGAAKGARSGRTASPFDGGGGGGGAGGIGGTGQGRGSAPGIEPQELPGPEKEEAPPLEEGQQLYRAVNVDTSKLSAEDQAKIFGTNPTKFNGTGGVF